MSMSHPNRLYYTPIQPMSPPADKQLFEYLKDWDSQKVLTVLGIAATVGISSAIIYFGSRESRRTSKKKSRVAFQEEEIDESPGNSEVSIIESTNDSNGNLQIRSLENEDNILVLKQCPRGRKTPCIAAFPLKLETFLRVHKIKYELDFNGYEPKLYGSPWIRFNTEDITESQSVIQFLIDKYDIRTEKELTGEQRAIMTAYTHLLENHLYWGIAMYRWVYDGARSLKEIQLLPKKTQELIPDVCKTVEQAAWFHGIGKLSPEDVKKEVLKDFGSLSEYLGNKQYFLDTEVPTELDCTAFGMLAQFLWNMSGPFHKAINEDKYKNLRDFCWRIRLKFWHDWEECLNNTEFYTDEPYPSADFGEFKF